MRIRDWRIAFGILLLFGSVMFSWGACPLLTHDDPNDQREFQNVCQQISNGPLVSLGSGTPSMTPRKVGDIYISTTTAKVYIATATTTSESWAIVN